MNQQEKIRRIVHVLMGTDQHHWYVRLGEPGGLESRIYDKREHAQHIAEHAIKTLMKALGEDQHDLD